MRESKSRALPLGYTPIWCWGKGRSGRPGPQPQYGVGNGARTHDTRNHNPVLCQLSYTHHIQLKGAPAKPSFGFVGKGETAERGIQSLSRRCGTPEGTRTPDLLLRRQLLYPPELQARMERVMGIEPTQPAWKAGILPLNYTRRRCLRKCQLGYDTTNPAACQSPQIKVPFTFCADNGNFVNFTKNLLHRPIFQEDTRFSGCPLVFYLLLMWCMSFSF